jgi:hypothetical protein
LKKRKKITPKTLHKKQTKKVVVAALPLVSWPLSKLVSIHAHPRPSAAAPV